MEGVIFLPTLLALLSSEPPRCALTDFNRLLPRLEAGRSLEGPAGRQAVFSGKTYQTEHFAFWWDPVSSEHKITGAAGIVAEGDSVPRMVRVAAIELERSWKSFVDTLGYLPPKAAETTFWKLWGQPVPAGKYPVEFCNVAEAFGAGNVKYFGGAYPDGNAGRSLIMLAANLSTFGGGNSYYADLDGKPVNLDYVDGWEEVVQATCAHELFHAVQFNYERELSRHGFHEASAVAMENRLVPWSDDYLQYAKSLANLRDLVPFPRAVESNAYPHGWFVRSMISDLGVEVVKDLWEARLTNSLAGPPEFLATMRQILPRRGGSFDSQLVRSSMRVALTGKRSGWTPQGFALFQDAARFPKLVGILDRADATTPLRLELGQFQIHLDTLPPAGDRLLVWLPDEGVAMGWARNSAAGDLVTWHRGSIRYSAAEAVRSAWVFANPGSPQALWSSSSADSSVSYWRSTAAPARTVAVVGQKLTWASPDGAVLSGMPRAGVSCTPLLHLDVWKPRASKDVFAASVAGGSDGRSIVLEDADGRLSLDGASLAVEGFQARSAFRGTGDGIWKPVPFSVTSGGTTLSLGELDLSRPVRLLLGGASAPRAMVLKPRPNPSRHGEAIRFPVTGATGSERVAIFAADGGLVDEIATVSGESEVVWSLRNREGEAVRPGVYRFVWRGVQGVSKGALIVAD